MFCNNSQALELVLSEKIHISECIFINHTLLQRRNYPQTVAYIKDTTTIRKGFIVIQNSTFNGNRGINKNCSSLYVSRIMNFTLDDTVFYDNNCTGITLSASKMTIQNHLNMTRNSGLLGGAMQLRQMLIPLPGVTELRKIFSRFTLKPQSKLNLIENSAIEYGGGIFTDENCEDRNKEKYCFFQVESLRRASRLLNFNNNTAEIGGDEIFGGCLQNCYLLLGPTINIAETKNIFWNITQFGIKSQSSFGEFPNQVVFCKNSSSFQNYVGKMSCNSSHQIRAFIGQLFTVSIMVVDNICFSSSGVVCAEIEDQTVHLGQKHACSQAGKYCENFSYSIYSSNDNNKPVILKLFLQSPRSLDVSPAILTVNLTSECPPGFKLD